MRKKQIIEIQDKTIRAYREAFEIAKETIEIQKEKVERLSNCITNLELLNGYLMFDVEATNREKDVLTRIIKDKNNE